MLMQRSPLKERKKESDLTSLFQARLAYWTAIALSALLLPPPKQVPKGK